MNIRETLKNISAELSTANVPSPEADAEILMAHALGVSVKELQLKKVFDEELSKVHIAQLAQLVARRAQREPLQHLTGKAAFRHLELAVGPGVFIPRPETETVVQWAIDEGKTRCEQGLTSVCVDLGTGSGAIAAALASEIPGSSVYAVELSDDAFDYAQNNLNPHNVHLVKADFAEAFPELNGRVDIVVSNPPYIPADAIPREQEVRDYDPKMALYGGGADGMQAPRAVIATAARLLKPGGYFILEHAEVQSEHMRKALAATGQFTEIMSIRDLNNKDRATAARCMGL